MLSTTAIPINAIVSFELYASSVLGTGYQGAKILAILDADSAFAYIDPPAMHANVYPSLPAGVPDAYDGYSYLKLKLASGQVTAIGIPWIKDDTFTVSTTRKMQITIDNVSPDNQNKVLLALSAAGFSVDGVKYFDS